jgi:hypothetical protein
MTILTHVTVRISPSAHPRATGQPGVGTKESPLTVFLTLSTYGPTQFMLTHLTNLFWPCNGLRFVSALLPLKTPTIINLKNWRIITHARKISKNLTGLCASTNREPSTSQTLQQCPPPTANFQKYCKSPDYQSQTHVKLLLTANRL